MALPTFPFGAVNTTSAAQTSDLVVGEKFSLETPEAGGLVKLPAYMQVINHTEGMTAQQSASTVQSGYGIHPARAFSQDGVTFGLLVEPAMTNLIDFQHVESGWIFSASQNVITGPDGSSAAYEVEDVSAAAIQSGAISLTPGNIVDDFTLSGWHLVRTLSAGTSHLEYEDGVNDPAVALTATEVDWAFGSTTVGEIDDGTLRIQPAETAVADTGATGWYGLQLEQRSYATSYFPASGGSRAADVLRAGHKSIMRRGFFRLSFTYRPHYDNDQVGIVDHNLIYFSATDRLYYRVSDDTFVFEVDGEELTVGAVTFSAHQQITITIEHSAARRRLIVSGATTGDGDVRTDPADPMREPSWVYILCGPDGAEEAADLVAFDQDALSFCDLVLCRMLIQMDRNPGARDFYDFMCAMSEENARMFDVLCVLQSAFELETAVGDQLDIIGSIVGLAREGFGDDQYRIYLEIQTEQLLSGLRDSAEWTGTVANILRIVRKFIESSAGTITYTLHAPYSFELSIPVVLTIAQIKLLMRFISTAIYAGVLGIVEFPLSTDVWGSDSGPITDSGIWGSASVVVAGASIWDLVLTTS